MSFLSGGLVFKRSVDVALAGLLLAFALPLLILAAIVVKLDSAGPILFRQVRMGRGFRRFQLLKLRTMNLCGDGEAYTLGADPRITRAGRWLRYFKVDELPQLWNVLRGEMSLVGPRPVIPALTVEFNLAYTRLLTVRPGLTDPASIKYCREAEMLASVPQPLHTFKTTITPDKIRISLEYLQRANVWSDLAVMVRTAYTLIPFEWRVWNRSGKDQVSQVSAPLVFPSARRRKRGENEVLSAGL